MWAMDSDMDPELSFLPCKPYCSILLLKLNLLPLSHTLWDSTSQLTTFSFFPLEILAVSPWVHLSSSSGFLQLGMVAHAYSLSSQKPGVGGSARLRLHSEIIFQKHQKKIK